MKKGKNLVLIGFMGSGKTSVGLKLSYRLRIPVEDTDKLIERREGRSISDIFAAEGEAFSAGWRRSCFVSFWKRIISEFIPWGAELSYARKTGSCWDSWGKWFI